MRTSEPAIFQAAFDKGVNYIDTARLHGRTQRGMVGEALKGYRDRVYGHQGEAGSKEAMIRHRRKSFLAEGGLRDLLQLHALSSAEQVMNTEYREVLAEAKKSGKTRFIGVTTHSKEPDVLNAVTTIPTSRTTPCWSRTTSRNAGSQGRHCKAAAANIGIIAMKTQAGGYQTRELYHSKRGIQSQNSNRA